MSYLVDILRKFFGVGESEDNKYMSLHKLCKYLALDNGIEYIRACNMSLGELENRMGRYDAALFYGYRKKMKKIYPLLAEIEKKR